MDGDIVIISPRLNPGRVCEYVNQNLPGVYELLVATGPFGVDRISYLMLYPRLS